MATIRLMIWSRSDVNNVWIKSGGGGGEEKTKEKGNGERRCSIGGLIETNEAQSFRALQISFVHTWLRAFLPRRRLVLFFFFSFLLRHLVADTSVRKDKVNSPRDYTSWLHEYTARRRSESRVR